MYVPEAQGGLPRGGTTEKVVLYARRTRTCLRRAVRPRTVRTVAPQVSSGYSKGRGHYKCILEAE